MNAEVYKEVVPAAPSKTDPKEYWIGGLCLGIIFGFCVAALFFVINPLNFAQMVPAFEFQDAEKFCKPHGGLMYIDVVRFEYKSGNDKIYCSDESVVLYKHIKDLRLK